MKKKKIIALLVSVIILALIALFLYFFVFRESDNNREFGSNVEKTDDGLVLIKGGSFNMGSPNDEMQRENDEVEHEVRLDDFYISPYEVTGEEYEKVMGENPSYFKGENLPVESVSWYEAIEYCNRLSEQEGLTPVYTIDENNVSFDKS